MDSDGVIECIVKLYQGGQGSGAQQLTRVEIVWRCSYRYVCSVYEKVANGEEINGKYTSLI
jgi:hypothetical protein